MEEEDSFVQLAVKVLKDSGKSLGGKGEGHHGSLGPKVSMK